MEQTVPTISRPASPDPAQDRFGCTAPASSIPERLAALLHVVRVLLGHGRRLAETTPDQAASEKFAILAAVCSTYNLPSILARVQRGIMRAMALERYLLARAEKGREIAFVYLRERTPAKPPATPSGEPERSRQRGLQRVRNRRPSPGAARSILTIYTYPHSRNSTPRCAAVR